MYIYTYIIHMATYIYKYLSHEEYLFLSHTHFLSPAYQKSLSKKHCHLAWEREKEILKVFVRQENWLFV